MYLQIFYLPFMISPWLFSYASALVADIPNLPKRTASSPTSTASASTSSGDATTLGPANRIFLDADTCTEPQQRQIEQAWKDAALLASAAVGGQYVLHYPCSILSMLLRILNSSKWAIASFLPPSIPFNVKRIQAD
jgi:hypothetical protein